MTDQNVAIYIGNGHAAWEAALANTLTAGDTVLVLATGRFCIGWGEMAADMGIKVQTIDCGDAAPIDLEQVEGALRADKGRKIKAILTVHVDTSTSVKNDIAGLRCVLDAAGHDALLMADCIATTDNNGLLVALCSECEGDCVLHKILLSTFGGDC
jgi:alanine-glyoxylate transaminase/serine-glyoxylate transaminase/serine-pyruvate transaminase